MSDYQQRIAVKKERYTELAKKFEGQSESLYAHAKKMAAVIPFGQPILVGHHSERSDRNYREKIRGTFAKSFAAAEKAEYYEKKAEGYGTHAISSDDPEAIGKLQEKLSTLQNLQEKMKAANKFVKKNDYAGLAALGYSAQEIAELFTPDFCGRVGFAQYQLANNNGAINKTRQRIAELQAKSKSVDKEEETEKYTYLESKEENRIMFKFSEKPQSKVIAKLKNCGFKWSPARLAWARIWTSNAVMSANWVKEFLKTAAAL